MTKVFSISGTVQISVLLVMSKVFTLPGSVLETLSSVNFLSSTLVPLMSSHPYSSSVIAAGVELFCLFCKFLQFKRPNVTFNLLIRSPDKNSST